MKFLGTLLTAAALLAGPVLAQNAAPDAQRLALAREVMVASKMTEMLEGITVQVKQMTAQMLAQQLASASPEERAQAEALQGKILDLSMSAVKDMLAKIDVLYAEVYTEPELKAILGFFKSAEGQSMIAKQPQLMQRMMPIVQQMQQDLMPKIEALVEADKAATAAKAAGPANPATDIKVK